VVVRRRVHVDQDLGRVEERAQRGGGRGVADRDDVEAGAPAAAQKVGAARRARVAGEGDEEADPAARVGARLVRPQERRHVDRSVDARAGAPEVLDVRL